MKVLLACTLDGHTAWISGPVNGKHYDIHILRESDPLDGIDHSA